MGADKASATGDENSHWLRVSAKSRSGRTRDAHVSLRMGWLPLRHDNASEKLSGGRGGHRLGFAIDGHWFGLNGGVTSEYFAKKRYQWRLSIN